MSLHRRLLPPVPAETARIAQRAFRRGNPYLRFRDSLGPIFDDADFIAVYGHAGAPAGSPALLALVTLLQYMEHLTDAQAADAVRSRLDWKYLLGLPLDDAGFDASVLSAFRTRLLEAGSAALLFDRVLSRLTADGLVTARGRQRTDSTHVLAAVRTLNRLEVVGETMRAALSGLALDAPTWLLAHHDPDWTERYGPRIAAARLPKATAAREQLLRQIAQDGFTLLAAVAQTDTPAIVQDHAAVTLLRRIWEQQFAQHDKGLHIRPGVDLPAATDLIRTPYDPEARWSVKRDTTWTGYKVHLTETCEEDEPRLITQVETTPAPVPDSAVTTTIQAELVAQGHAPASHLMDAGYIGTAVLVESEALGIAIVGPIQADSSWQAQADAGFAGKDFIIDRDREVATCPQGSQSSTWRHTTDRAGRPSIQVHFRVADCGPCPVREQCTRADRRSLRLQSASDHAALTAARQAQTTAAFAQEYAARAGIEATISHAVRSHGLRQARYRGGAKTHLQHLLTAAAINLSRTLAWLAGERPCSAHPSPYARLMAHATQP